MLLYGEYPVSAEALNIMRIIILYFKKFNYVFLSNVKENLHLDYQHCDHMYLKKLATRIF